MKAISLHQPWASLIMLGAKRLETRSWRPPEALIGQRVLIHATKRIDPCVCHAPFSQYITHPVFDAPTGVLLGSAKIEGAWRIDCAADARRCAGEYHRIGTGSNIRAFLEAIDHELCFGDYTVGRWAWGLGDVRPLHKPLPCRGHQKFWEVQLSGVLWDESVEHVGHLVEGAI